MSSLFFSLIAIFLWATLASLGVLLKHLPPFLLTGLALVIGSLWALPRIGRNSGVWHVRSTTMTLGIVTFFGFHFCLFLGLRLASPIEVNLVNYLWPLLIVVLAPRYLRDSASNPWLLVAGLMGFLGAAVAIFGAQNATHANGITPVPGNGAWRNTVGYVLALLSALLWANYSLMTRRLVDQGEEFPTASIGLFCFFAGVLSLLCHLVLETTPSLSAHDMLLVGAMGLGPLGAAFYAWDKALKTGEARQIGILSYLTPLLSTVLLLWTTNRPFSWHIVLATALILGAALIGTVKSHHKD